MSEPRGYWPAIEGGTVVRLFTFGEHRAVLLTGMRSLGVIQYLHVLLIFEVPENRLCLCVSSEKNLLYGRSAPGGEPRDVGGSHFLGLFHGQGHVNFGSSNDWADLEKFCTRALEVARGPLGVPAEAVEEIPVTPWWRN